MFIIGVLCTLISPAADVPPGDRPSPDHQRAVELVKQLGHPRFAVRESAGKKLIELGESAVAALQDGTQSDDLEIRYRSGAVLGLLKDETWSRRSAAYVAGRESKGSRDLPLLAEWEKVVGSADPASRRFFADMLQMNGELFELTAASPARARFGLSSKCSQLSRDARMTLSPRGSYWPSLVPIHAHDVAAVLFVQTVVDRNRTSDMPVDIAPSLLLRTPFAGAATEDEEIGRVFRLLINAWIQSRPLTDHHAAFALTETAVLYPLPETIPQLVRIIKDDHWLSQAVRWQAIAGIERVGNARAIEALEELLTDPLPIAAGRGGIIQVRDCALGCLVNLKGKDPSEYGLTETIEWRVTGYNYSGSGTTTRLYGFANSEARVVAFGKWNQRFRNK
jgi:hypothetical protein